MRLLLVEDDEILAQTLMAELTAQNYVVDVANDGEAGWDYAQALNYDLILLDVSLPKQDGLSLCRRLRDHRCRCPILLLTAKGDDTDKVKGLDAGADDYVVKPCTLEELSARIRALLRRQDGVATPILQWGLLRLDPSVSEFTYGERVLALSAKEYSLLELFIRSPRRIFSSSAILDRLWSFDDVPTEDTVRAHIKRLRRKLKNVGAEELIETVYGMGYRFKQLPIPDIHPTTSEAIRGRINQTWQIFKKPTFERINLLLAYLADPCPQNREEAQNAAHKLAGSLGMFGYSQGSQWSRQIETYLKQGINLDYIPKIAELISNLQQALQQNPDWQVVTPPPSSSLPQFSLLVIGADGELIQLLATEGWQWGIEILATSDLLTAYTQIQQQPPHAVLLTVSLPEAEPSVLELLEKLSLEVPHLPVLVLTEQMDFPQRLTVARRGGRRMLSAALSPAQILAAVERSLQPRQKNDLKVLAVDDDPLLLDSLTRLLPQWGLEVISLNDPSQFWEALKQTVPDLLLLDLEMPGITGLELCQVVRQDSQWDKLPILFLTSHREADMIQRLFNAGADDYICKPFSEPELIARLFNRWERNRLLRNLAETDALTGLLNRQQALKILENYLNLVQRYNHSLTLAWLKLEDFQEIIWQHGYKVGDSLVQKIAQILRQEISDQDIIARWGEQEFFLAWYQTDVEGARHKLESCVKQLKQIMLPDGDRVFNFTIAMVQSPLEGTDFLNLYRQAKQKQ